MVESALSNQRERLDRLRADAERLETVVAGARTVRTALADRAERMERDRERIRTDDEITAAFGRFLQQSFPAAVLADPVGELPFDAFVTAVETFLSDGGAADADPTAGLGGQWGLGPGERFLERRWDRSPIRIDDPSAVPERRAAVDEFAALLEGVDASGMALLADGFERVVDNAAAERNRVRAEINRAKAGHVSTLETADERGVDPMAALSWDAPIAMLPVRLETRFVDADGGVEGDPVALRVRIYPEQIHVDSHEPELTAREREWGRRFWGRLWLVAHDLPTAVSDPSGGVQPVDAYDPSRLPAGLRDPVAGLFEQLDDFAADPGDRFEQVRERAWGRGVDSFGRERAAWIVHALGPVDGQGEGVDARLLAGWDDGDPPFGADRPPALAFPAVPDKPDSWSRQPRLRLLPDRWVVRARWSDDSGTERVERVTGNPIAEPLFAGPDPSNVANTAASAGDTVAGDGVEWMVDYSRAESVGMAVTVDLPSGFVTEEGFSTVEVTGLRTSSDRTSTAEELEELVSAHHYTDGLSLLSPGTPTNNADEPSGHSSARDPAGSAPVEVGAPLVTGGDGTDGDLTATGLGIASDGRNHVFANVDGADTRHAATAGDLQRVLWPATLGYHTKHLLLGWDWERLYDGEPGVGDYETPLTQELMGETVLSWLDEYRTHFTEYVRADGPLGTIRTGRQPYGVLPVTPFDTPPSSLGDPIETDEGDDGGEESTDWSPRRLGDVDDGVVTTDLIERVWGLRDAWRDAAAGLPTVTDDGADQALLDALGREATASRYRRRSWLLGEDHPVFGRVLDAERFEVGDPQVDRALSTAGFDGFDPRLDDLLTLGFTATATSEELPLTDDSIDTYLQLLSTMLSDAPQWPPLNPLRALGTHPDAETIQALGIAIARRWVLGRYGRRGFDDVLSADDSLLRQLLLVAVQRACVSSRIRMAALYGDPPTVGPEPTGYDHGDRTAYDDLEDPIPDALANHPSLSSGDEYRDAIGASVAGDAPQVDPVLASFAASLDRLGRIDPESADLDRIARGAIDLCSHRLDAWWTSVATRRLERVREREPDVHVGAYGYVTDLTPDPDTDAEYLLAPSQNQATTASILRNGHKTDADGPHGETLAVDLSAERLQAVWPYLTGVRNGSSLSELVGYRFERGLHRISEDDDNAVTDAERYIAPFREAYPSIAGRLNHGGAEPGEVDLSAASEVVDGMAVYEAWDDGDLPRGDPFPEPNSAASAEIDALLSEIDDEIDAIADLLVAESVHQLATGNVQRASAALEALSRGELMQDPAVLDTPRTETGVNHRLLLLFGDADSVPTPSDWQVSLRETLRVADLPDALSLPYVDRSDLAEPIDPDLLDPSPVDGDGARTLDSVSVRSDAEPALDGWLGEQLPSPDRVGCRAAFQWTADRDFATGSIEVPDGPERVSVDDVGFEPDLLVFTASTGVETITESVGAASTVPGWLHGTATVAADGAVTQQSTSVAVGPTETHYATDSSAAINVPLRTADGAAGTITGRLRRTTDDGFELAFSTVETPTDGTLSVAYTAVKTGDRSEVRAGSFVARPPSATDVDDGDATQTVDLGVDADHVRLTATTATGAADASGSVADAGGLSRGIAVADAGGEIGQTVTAAATDPTTGADARTVSEDAALDLLYPDGERLDGRTTARVTGLGSTLELAYRRPDEGVPWAATPRLVTYVAVDSARAETSDGAVGGPPAVGTVTVPADGETVTVETDGKPGAIAVTGVGGVSTADGATTPALDAGAACWSEGFAVGPTAQTVRSHGGDVRYGSDHHVLSLPRPDADGGVAGHRRGKITAVTEEGFRLSISGDGDGDGTAVLRYEAWPAAPEERSFAVASDCRFDELDLSPLDAVALTATQGETDGSALERRIGYRLFRRRPRNDPPIQDDAELELSFGDTPEDADVSVAAFVEHARSLSELIGEARPADATDLAHPSAEAEEGYLDGQSTNAPGTADRLADRADGAAEAVTEIEAMIANRLATLDDESGPTLIEMAERIEEATASLDRAAPLSQLVDTVGRLADYARPDGQSQSLPAELRAMAGALRAGPTELSETLAEAHVPPEQGATLSVATDAPRTDVTVTLGSAGEPALWETRSVRTDDEGVASVTVDLDGYPDGTGLLVTVVTEERLDEAVWRALSRLPVEEQAELVLEIAADRLDDERREALEEYEDEPGERRRSLIESLPTEAKLAILAQLGFEARAERFERRLRSGDGTVREVLASRSFRIVPPRPEPSALPSLLEEEFVILPRLFWLRRLLAVVDPSRADAPAAAIDDAVRDAHWDGLHSETELAERVSALTRAAGDDALTDADLRAIGALLELERHELDALADAIDAVVEPLERLGVTDIVNARGDLAKPWAGRYATVAGAEVESPLGRGPRGEVRGRIRSFLADPELDLPVEFGGFDPGLRRVLSDRIGDPDAPAVARALAALVRRPEPVVTALAGHVDEPHLLVRDLTALTSHPSLFARHGDPAAFQERLSDATAALSQSGSDPATLFDDRIDDPRALADALERAIPDLTGYAVRVARTGAQSYGAGPADRIARDHLDDLVDLEYATDGAVRDRLRPLLDGESPTRALRKSSLEALRLALVRATYVGVYGATPQSRTGGRPADRRTLLAQARSVAGKLRDRRRSAAAYDPDEVAAEPTVDGQRARLEALLGEEFTVLPPFAPTDPAAVRSAFADSERALGDDPYAVDTWLQRIARIRDQPALLRDALTYADALSLADDGDTHDRLAVGQLGHDSVDWIGRDGETPDGGELSMVAAFGSRAGTDAPLARTPGRNGQPPVAGLALDGWVDPVPATEETIGVGLQYDDAGARAPQSALLAVPPAWERRGESWTPTDPVEWSREALQTTLSETRELVELRGVDLDALEEFGHTLPGLVFPYNDTTVAGSSESVPDAPSVRFGRFDWWDGGE